MMHRRKGLIALLMALALAVAACGGGTATDTTLDPSSPLASTTTLAGAVDTTEAADTATTTPAEEFDVEAAVVDYATNIPEGWMMVKELDDFKDAVEASDALIIDVREPSEYAEGHIMDAINIPLRTLADNLDKIPTDRQVFVYCKSGWRGGTATSSLAMMGYDNVKGYPAGWVGWTDAGEEINLDPVEAEIVGDPGLQPELVAAVDDFLNNIPEGWLTAGDAQNVSDAIDAGAFVVDVREPDEYADGHMASAVNVPVRELGTTDVEFPTDTSMIHYCGSGWRASLSTPIIHILGNDNDKGYSSTWASWADEGFPVES